MDPSPNVSEKPLSDDDQAEIRRLDALIAVSRERTSDESRVSVAELKWLLLGTVFLMLPMAISYVSLPVENRRTVAAYIAVVGFVLAAWGMIRSWLARNRRAIAGVAVLYLLLFAMNFGIYGVTLLNLTLDLDLQSQGPMRKK